MLSGLDEFTAKMSSATSEEDKVIAQIGVEVYQAMVAALIKK